jgi:probable phosphoglycerate mutase
MTRLYVIRHAEAEGNIYRRLHGQYNSRITANGERQVEALRERFLDVPIDAVYASDLFRTRQTARAVTVPKGLELRPEPRLREVHTGCWENQTFGWLEQTEPEKLRQFLKDPEQWCVEGSERYEDYSRRFVEALEDIARANEGGTVAVFTHGCVSSGGFHRLLGLPHNAELCDNTGVSLLRWENGVFTPEFLYDNSHLTEAISTRARQRWWRQGGGRFNLWFRDPAAGDAGLFAEGFEPPAGHRVRIAMLGQEPVGYLCHDGRTVSVLWLRPEYRHRRMGDQLLGEAVMTLRAGGVKDLSVGIPTVNVEALAFFARHGAGIAQMDDVYTVYTMDLRVE